MRQRNKRTWITILPCKSDDFARQGHVTWSCPISVVSWLNKRTWIVVLKSETVWRRADTWQNLAGDWMNHLSITILPCKSDDFARSHTSCPSCPGPNHRWIRHLNPDEMDSYLVSWCFDLFKSRKNQRHLTLQIWYLVHYLLYAILPGFIYYYLI